MTQKYNDKINEVGDKFNSFLAALSHDISHGTFYHELQLQYFVEVGSAGSVDLHDLLSWINGVALPPGHAADGQGQASGFLSSVKNQPGGVPLNIHASSDASSADDLASFLSLGYFAGDSSVGVVQVIILCRDLHYQSYELLLFYRISPKRPY